MRIPIYKPYLNDVETNLLNRAIQSGWVSSLGEYIDMFEIGFKNYTGFKEASTCCNGSVALHLALLALGVSQGDKVIVPSFTYVATANAIKYVGAEPVFVDSDLQSWNIDFSSINQQDLLEAKAVITVDIYGNPSIDQSTYDFLKSYDLLIVNDCAESFGSFVDGNHVGHLADVSTFSFFGNKTITTGEGGMVASNDPNVIKRVELLKNQGRSREHPYFHDILGFNYRMTNLQAAIGYGQLSKVDNILVRKSEIFHKYWSTLENFGFLKQFVFEGAVNSYWLSAFRAPSAAALSSLRDGLHKSEIDTRPFFIPLTDLPFYAQRSKSFANSDLLSETGICLPSFPGLTNEELERINEVCKRSLLTC